MNKIKNLSIFIVAFSVLMIGASAASTIGSISPVFASTDNSNKDDQSNNDQSNNDQSNNDQSNNDQSNNDQSSSSQTANEQPSLETVDTHLESCIQQIQNDNTDEALNDCQNADDELDRLLANATG
jgi:basic membrane lipoprotein Med (substrate-binding protein (PBP1-ABC) superfamily)